MDSFNRSLLLGFIAATLCLSLTVRASAQIPELFYYKFDEASGTVTANLAVPGVGTSPAPITGHMLGTGGQFNRALVGIGGSSGTNHVNTGWPTAFGTSSWTISFWFDNTTSGAGTTLQYIFGESTAGSFRVFSEGVAGAGNLILRGGGLTDIIISGGARTTSPVVVAWVYDSTVNTVYGYRDGVLVNTVVQSAPNINGTTSLKIGGYGSGTALFNNARMDEVRVYNRALSAAEIAATWNIELAVNPTCAINSPMSSAAVSGTVMVNHDVAHPTSALTDALYEYSLDAGATWYSATPAGLSVNPTIGIVTPSAGRIFEWDTVADSIGTLAPATVELRITVTDGAAATSNCIVNSLSIDNVPPPPTCTLALPAPGVASGQISFNFTPNSISAPSVDATFEFSTDGGTTFLMATAGGASTNPLLGVPITVLSNFVWNSRADSVGLVALEIGVILRATVVDGTPLAGNCQTAPFDVDNTSLCPGVCGDCNLGTTGPDILDALTGAQIAAGLVIASPAQVGCCDVNASMVVDIIDSLFMAQSSAGLPVIIICP